MALKVQVTLVAILGYSWEVVESLGGEAGWEDIGALGSVLEPRDPTLLFLSACQPP